MLPFKFRTNKIQEIEFRNVFQNAQSLGQYYMEISYFKPRHMGEEKTEEIVFSSDTLGDSAQPCFEISSQNVTQSKQFIKDFENINNIEATIRLKIKDSDQFEEFKVNWLDIQYLTKDLGKLMPYTMPIIIFNFNLISGSQISSGSEKRGMYFTTKPIWDQLFNLDKLQESYDPEKILSQHFRYYRELEV